MTMAVQDFTRADFGVIAQLLRNIEGLAARLTDWRDRRATQKALAGLSDHELDDIGLTRADIDAISR